MSEAERKRLDHVVLPRRLPGLALLERHLPSPADNLLDAELAAFAQPGDTVLDPWAGTGWTARRAVAARDARRRRRSEPVRPARRDRLPHRPGGVGARCRIRTSSPASRRVDVPLRQHIEELYATHCAACRRPVVADQFIWPRDGDAPGRKIYRCANCDDRGRRTRGARRPGRRGGPRQARHPAPGDGRRARSIADSAADAEEDLPPAPVGLTGSDDPLERRPRGAPGRARRAARATGAGHRAELARRRWSALRLDRAAGPAPAWRTAAGVRQSPHTSSCATASRSSTAGRSSSTSCSSLYTPAQPVRAPYDRQQDRREFRDGPSRRSCGWPLPPASCRPAA